MQGPPIVQRPGHVGTASIGCRRRSRLHLHRRSQFIWHFPSANDPACHDSHHTHGLMSTPKPTRVAWLIRNLTRHQTPSRIVEALHMSKNPWPSPFRRGMWSVGRKTVLMTEYSIDWHISWFGWLPSRRDLCHFFELRTPFNGAHLRK